MIILIMVSFPFSFVFYTLRIIVYVDVLVAEISNYCIHFQRAIPDGK